MYKTSLQQLGGLHHKAAVERLQNLVDYREGTDAHIEMDPQYLQHQLCTYLSTSVHTHTESVYEWVMLVSVGLLHPKDREAVI